MKKRASIKDLIQAHEEHSAITAKFDIIRAMNNPTLNGQLQKLQQEVKTSARRLVVAQLLYETNETALASGLKGDGLLAPLIKDSITVREVDGLPVASLNHNGIIVNPATYVMAAKGSSDLGFLFSDGAAPVTTPSGKNPFKRGEHYNLTEQGRILASNPELATRLKIEATEGE